MAERRVIDLMVLYGETAKFGELPVYIEQVKALAGGSGSVWV